MRLWTRIGAFALALVMPLLLAGLALAAEGDVPRVPPSAEAKAAAQTLARARDTGGGARRPPGAQPHATCRLSRMCSIIALRSRSLVLRGSLMLRHNWRGVRP